MNDRVQQEGQERRIEVTGPLASVTSSRTANRSVGILSTNCGPRLAMNHWGPRTLMHHITYRNSSTPLGRNLRRGAAGLSRRPAEDGWLDQPGKLKGARRRVRWRLCLMCTLPTLREATTGEVSPAGWRRRPANRDTPARTPRSCGPGCSARTARCRTSAPISSGRRGAVSVAAIASASASGLGSRHHLRSQLLSQDLGVGAHVRNDGRHPARHRFHQADRLALAPRRQHERRPAGDRTAEPGPSSRGIAPVRRPRGARRGLATPRPGCRRHR